MKKRIFALALAVCMMLSVMPTSFAGLSLGGSTPAVEPVEQPVVESSGGLSLGGTVQEEVEPQTPSTGVLTSGGLAAEEEEPEEEETEKPQAPTGVLYTQCAFCGYLDNTHADDCPTLQPEEEQSVEEPASQPTQVTQEEITTKTVTNYTAETVSTQSTSGSERLNIQRNAVAYNTLSASLMTTGEEEDDPYAVSRLADTEYNYTYTVTPVTPGSSGTSDQSTLKVDKYLSDDGKNLIMEAYVTGEYKTTPVDKKVPTDFILIIDQSGSMAKDWNGGYGSPRRLASLKTALNSFLSMVQTENTELREQLDANEATKDTVGHRIAMVGFADGNKDDHWEFYLGEYGNTELFDGSSQINYADAKANNYAAAFKNMDALADGSTPGVTAIQNSISAIDASGSTFVSYGFDMANKILENDPIGSANRNKVVILFTDGYPGYSGSNSSTAHANAAISAADNLRADDVAVFAVGFNADGNTNFTTYMTNIAGGADNYLQGNNPDALEEAFESIPELVGGSSTTSTLNAATELRDYITDQFEINGTPAIEVYDYTGKDSDGNLTFRRNDTDSATLAGKNTDAVSLDKTTVIVSGFDYATKYVVDEGNTPRGQKVVVTIPIKVKDGFLGGNNVPTNTSASGIYFGETKEKQFPIPSADVSIPAVTFTGKSETIYYGGDVPATLYNEYAVEADWMDAYVNLSYTDPTDISNSACRTDYSVKLTITPKNSGTVSIREFSAAAAVHVLEPVIKSDDKIIHLGNELGDALNASHTWACEHGNKTASAGYTEPVIDAGDYTYQLDSKSVVSTDKPNDCDGNYNASLVLNGKTFSAEKDFAVHVLKPTVTFRDTTIYLGHSPAYDTENLVKTTAITWADKTDTKNGTVVGVAPTIEDFKFSYQIDVDHTKCNTVNVTGVEINGKDFTGDVFFANATTTITDNVKFTVHVLKPVVNVTLTDTTAYYGDEYVLGTGANGNITLDWKDADQTAPWVNPVGEAPYGAGNLSLAYAADDATDGKIIMPNSDVTVTATVMLNGKAFEDSIPTFATTCSNGCAKKTDGTYVVHPLTCTLTIKNEGWDKLDANQSFIFNVVGANAQYPVNVRVVIDENGEAKIVGLPVGTYTVSADDGDWSWRYATTGDSDTVSASKPDGKVTMRNVRDNIYWFDAIAETVKNIFNKGGNNE